MQYAYRNWYVPQTSVEIEGRLGVAQVIGHVSSYTEAVSSHIPSCPIYKAALKRKKNRTKENSIISTYSDTDLKYCIYPIIISNKSFKTEQFHVLYWHFIFSLSPQSSEPVKELYTQLTEKLEAQKKSPPPLEETPSLDLGLHPVTVPTTASTPTTPLWGEKTRTFHQWLTVNEATSWLVNFQKDWTFYTIIYWMIFLGGFLSVHVSCSDSVVQRERARVGGGGVITFLNFVLLHYCPNIQYFHM